MKKLFCKIMIFLLSTLLFAQEAGNNKPYVTKLRARAQDTTIVLTWKNKDTITNTLLIYKYTERISEENISKAEKIAALSYDKSSYTYFPVDTNSYFFSVIYADDSGNPYNIFIEYRNITTKGVNVTSVGSEENLATEITGIKTTVDGEAIIISFKSSKPERELMLFRSTAPIASIDDLSSAGSFAALDAGTSSYKDYPIAGIDYYYAVQDAGLVKVGKMLILLGRNTSTSAISLPLSQAEANDLVKKSKRSLPLPLLSLSTNVESGSNLVRSTAILLPNKKPISEKTGDYVAGLITKIDLEESFHESMEVLEIDLIENPVGEAFSLQKIIQKYFLKKNYMEAGEELLNFLKIKHSKEVEARTHFYLGQILYVQRKYQAAFLEFLLAGNSYYAEVQPWIDSTFMRLDQLN